MEKGSPEFTQQVVRSLLVCLASPSEIYHNYQEQKHIPSVLRFYVGIKGETTDKRYSLLGGKLKDSENWKEGVQREIGEEIGLRPFGIPGQTNVGSWKYSAEKSGSREVMLTYNPVLSCNQIAIGDPKIDSLVTLSLEELAQLFVEGHLNGIPIEGHLAVGKSAKDPIYISSENIQKKDLSLLKALDWMGHIEEYLKRRFEKILLSPDGVVSESQFRGEYEKILSEYMRKGFEIAVKKKIESSLEKRHDLIEVLDGGYLGKDILYYLPELATHGINWPGLKNSTEGVKIFIDFLKDTFGEFLHEQELSSENYGIQMRDPQVPLEKKTLMLNALNQFFKNRLKDIFNVGDEELNQISGYIQNFFRDLSNEMKVADPELREGLYQDFTLVNEVNNANFGYLLSLFLGFDTKKNTGETNKLIRFEAGRQLVLLLKGLSGIKLYRTEIESIREGRLKAAVNNFFGPILSKDVVILDTNQYMRANIRQANNQNVIVDERPMKSFTSFLRKSFEERAQEISDFHSISVVFRDQDDNNLINTELLIDQFQQFVSVNFPGSQLSLFGRNNYGTENYSKSQKNGTEVHGKRNGSQADKLVRTKLIFQLDQEKLELTIYPFFSIPDEDDNYWGWLEKIRDDKNYVVRRLLAGKDGIPSTYDLLLPPELYPHNFQQKLHAKYHK